MPLSYKLGLIKTLIDRVYKICHDIITFNLEIKHVKEYLCKNAYPPPPAPHTHTLSREIKKYLHKVNLRSTHSDNGNNYHDNNINNNKCYFKLP